MPTVTTNEIASKYTLGEIKQLICDNLKLPEQAVSVQWITKLQYDDDNRGPGYHIVDHVSVKVDQSKLHPSLWVKQ